ncbi:MAG: T9SS type A sorting domain-containing protein [Bacteroidia bacterium]|nr:T9SS type A sorting domain-containing protein [Bacteroidia bacterium]
MKKSLLLLSSTAFLFCNQVSSQNDTLLWADFETDPSAFINTTVPPSNSTDLSWYNADGDGLADGSGQSRPLEWFWSAGFATVDTANGVMASSSWTNTSTATENWLITKSLVITDALANLSWKSAPFQTPRYLDGYLVLVSTATNDFADFTDTLFTAAEYQSLNNASLPNVYASYSFSSGFVHGQDSTYTEVDAAAPDSSRLAGVLRPFSASLAAYAGQNIFIAFVHKSVDDNLICVDDILVMGTNNVGIKEQLSGINFNLYPNPATDKLNISFDLENSSEISVSLFDLLGKKVYAQTLGKLANGNHKQSIDVTGFSSGMYQVQLTTSKGVVNSKLQVK